MHGIDSTAISPHSTDLMSTWIVPLSVRLTTFLRDLVVSSDLALYFCSLDGSSSDFSAPRGPRKPNSSQSYKSNTISIDYSTTEEFSIGRRVKSSNPHRQRRDAQRNFYDTLSKEFSKFHTSTDTSKITTFLHTDRINTFLYTGSPFLKDPSEKKLTDKNHQNPFEDNLKREKRLRKKLIDLFHIIKGHIIKSSIYQQIL